MVLAAGWVAWESQWPERCFERGLRELAAGNPRAALAESRKLRTATGFEAQSHVLAGAALADSGRYAEALGRLEQVPESSPVAARAMTLAARCRYQLGQFRDAAAVALAALQQDETAIEARRWLASALYDLGAAGPAAEQLRLIARADPHDGRPDRLLGLIEKDHEAYDRAVEHYQESLRRDPRPADRCEIVKELAQSQIRLSRFNDALKSLADCDETAAMLTLAAECHAALGRPEAARAAVDRALDDEPDLIEARLLRVDLNLAKGAFRDAVEDLEHVLRLRPYHQQAHFKLSQAYSRLGDRAKADEHVALMKESQALAREFSDLHDMITADAEDPEPRHRLGVLAQKRGERDLARMWFRAALAIDPHHAASRAALDALGPGSDAAGRHGPGLP